MLQRLVTGLRVTAWGLFLIYPLVLYWAKSRYGLGGAAAVGLGTGILWVARAASMSGGGRSLWALPAIVLTLSALTLLMSDARLLLFLPVFINGVLLVAFASSLRGPESYVERIARRLEPNMTPDKARHCRQFTWIWSGFFVVNGVITAGLALAEAMVLWAAYTSVISYVFIGLLFLVEWGVRRRRFGVAGAEARTRGLEPR